MAHEFLGKVLDYDLVEKIRNTGSDACGENGEYHTFVYDGPTFNHPIQIKPGKVIDFNTYSVIDIQLA
jgi:diphthamide synthase (EF-2-diphthine--ammonia ligase)